MRAAFPTAKEGLGMSLFLFLSQLLNGLLDGFYYLLIAIGLSLIFSLGGIVNLAHGAFFAIGAYLAIVVSPYTGFFGAVIVVPLLVAGLGMLTERLLFTRFYRVDPLYSLLLTFGMAWSSSNPCDGHSARHPWPIPFPTRCAGRCFWATSSIRATASF
jgi:branched-chain amino acid transport system permease protein